MLYIKDGIFRDSTKYLKTSDGRTIFNASREQWEAEGWKVYVPEPVPVEEKTLEDKKLDLLEDARNFKESVMEIRMSREDRVYLRQLAEDLLAEGIQEAQVFDDRDDFIHLPSFLDWLKDLNVLEYTYRTVLQNHLDAIKKLETEEDVDNYDYTTGYPDIPEI